MINTHHFFIATCISTVNGSNIAALRWQLWINNDSNGQKQEKNKEKQNKTNMLPEIICIRDFRVAVLVVFLFVCFVLFYFFCIKDLFNKFKCITFIVRSKHYFILRKYVIYVKWTAVYFFRLFCQVILNRNANLIVNKNIKWSVALTVYCLWPICFHIA